MLIAGGTALFLALAIADQWSFFASAWFSPKASQPERQSCPPAAIEAVGRLVNNLPQFYSNPSDPEAFFSSIRLTPTLMGEMVADLSYLSTRDWKQSMELAGYSIVGSRQLPKGRWEVVTDETWSVKIAGEGYETSSETRLRCRYVAGSVEGRWTIGSMSLEPVPDGDGH